MPITYQRSAIQLVQGVAFAALVVASVVVLWPVQRDIAHRLQILKSEVVVRLEGATGRKISYESISPSIFRFLEIRGLTIYDKDEPQTPLVKIRRVEVTYSIFKLLSGKPGDAITGISIENSSLAINTQTDQDLIRFLRELASGGAGSRATASAFPGNVRISGKNLSVSVTGPDGTVSVDRLFVDLRNTTQAIDVQVRGGFAFAPAGKPFGLSDVETAVRVSGQIDHGFAWSDLRVRFDSLSSNLVNVSRPTFRVSLRNGVWQLRKIQDKAPLDLQASYDINTRLFHAAFAADGFRPDYYFTFGHDLDRYSPWLSTVISGNGSFSYEIGSRVINYAVDASAHFSNRYLPVAVTVASDLTGNANEVDIARMAVTSPYGNAQFTGSLDYADFLPQGSLSLRDVRLPIDRDLNGDFDLSRNGGTLVANSGNVLLGGSSLFAFSLRVVPQNNSFGFTLQTSVTQDAQRPQLTARGVASIQSSPFVQLSVSTEKLPLQEAYSLGAPRVLPAVSDSLAGLTMTSQIFIATDLKKFSFASPAATIVDSSSPDSRVIHVSLSGNDKSLDLRSLSVSWDGYQVSGSAEAAYIRKDRVQFASTLALKDTSYSFSGFYQVDDSLVATGSFGFDLAAIKEGDHYVFTLRTSKLPIPFATTTSTINLDLEGVYSDPAHWEVVSRSSSATDLPVLPAKDNAVQVSARVTSQGGEIYSLTYSDQFSKVSGTGKLSLQSMSPGFEGSGWLQLSGENGEAYSGTFSFSPGSISSDVSFTDSPLARFGSLPISGEVSGDVALSGLISDPDISVRLSLPDGLIYSDPLTATAAFSLTRSRLNITDLDARYLSSTVSGAGGSLDFGTGDFSLDASYRGEVNGDLITAKVALGGTTAAVGDRANIGALFSHDVHAKASVTSITVAGQAVKSWDVSLDKTGGQVQFAGGPAGGISGSLLPTGEFAVTLRDPLPITLQATGTVTGSTIDASLQNVVMDLHAFDSVVKIPYFDISRGKARGNLQISGAVNDPDIAGDLSASAVYGKTLVVPDEIGPFSTDMVFQGKTLSMADVAIRVGSSQVLGNLDFTIDHWLPAEFDLQFTTLSPQGVHVKYNVSDIDFDGYATGTTTIQGDPLGTKVTGALTIDSCVVTINGQTAKAAPASAAAPKLDNTIYNFTFTTGKQVQFVWPSQSVPIVRSFADAGQTLRITSNGNTGAFSIVGNVNVRGGEVFYFRQSFYIREGAIAFNEDQNKVDPIINLRAELREVDDQGKNVSIYLIVDNKPLSQFAPRFESDPVLPNDQILAMLGQSVYAQLGGQQIDPGSAFALPLDLLGQFTLVRAFEDRLKQALNLDLFSIRTDLLQNVIEEKLLGVTPPTTATPTSSLGRYLDNTTLFLGKYFGNDLFLEAMINLRSNNAFLDEYGNNGNLEWDSQVLLEWKTPLFLLQLSVLPSQTDFLSSLLNTSLSLSWGFSF